LGSASHRVFDEVLKHQRRPGLDQAAAFCDLADLDGSEAKAFRKRGDGRARILVVARGTTRRPTLPSRFAMTTGMLLAAKKRASVAPTRPEPMMA